MLDEGDPQSFRVRAYESAAQAIAAQATDLGELSAKELQKIEGIGKSTAAKIRELLETGKVAKLEELRAEAPGERRRAAAHPGARAEGGAEAPRASSACSRSTICARRWPSTSSAALKGFGEKSEEKLAHALARLDAQGPLDRTPISVALPLAERIVARMLEVPGVTHASYCGSLRRFSRDDRRRRRRGRGGRRRRR